MSGSATKQFVLFKLAEQEYALPIDCVSSVETRREINEVPKAPPHVLGVMALRGKLIPIISVRRVLGVKEAGAEQEQHVLFVMHMGQSVGLSVDLVTGIRQLDIAMIAASKGVIKDIKAQYVKGVAEDEDRLVVVLDLSELISLDDNLLEHSGVGLGERTGTAG